MFPRHSVTALLLLCLSACTTQQYSYIQRAHQGTPRRGQIDFHQTPELDDVVAINFANSVAMAMRSRLTGSRVTREVSSTVQVGLAAFGGAGAALGYGATTLTALGLGSASIPEVQGIFNAKGRAEVYRDAAKMIDNSILEYYSFNPTPDAGVLTPNGISLLHRTMASIHLVEQSLTGQLPSVQDMAEATERMSAAGSVGHVQGDEPTNFISARGDAPLGKLTFSEIKSRKGGTIARSTGGESRTVNPGSIFIPRQFQNRNQALQRSYLNLTEGRAADVLATATIERNLNLTAKQQVALEILREGGFRTDVKPDPADALQYHRERAVDEATTAALEKGSKNLASWNRRKRAG